MCWSEHFTREKKAKRKEFFSSQEEETGKRKLFKLFGVKENSVSIKYKINKNTPTIILITKK